MRESLSAKLSSLSSEYLSVGVTESENGYSSIPIPWVHTSTAYNMQIPNIYITKDELLNDEVINEIKKFKVIGFYIDVPLEDYEFLREFPLIRDLSILKGENINDLSFLESLEECRMLFLEKVAVKNLDPILKAKLSKAQENRLNIPYVWVGLYDCAIEDISGLQNINISFFELLIWSKNKENEKNRWKNLKASTFRYYELD